MSLRAVVVVLLTLFGGMALTLAPGLGCGEHMVGTFMVGLVMGKVFFSFVRGVAE